VFESLLGLLPRLVSCPVDFSLKPRREATNVLLKPPEIVFALFDRGFALLPAFLQSLLLFAVPLVECSRFLVELVLELLSLERLFVLVLFGLTLALLL
jgi:hypothetical protein